ncbi:MAG: hypothetical protein KTR23_17365 [Rhodospirillales bacterium]|nr:hypothetical protein [Rhodospirillales bacterium]
MSPVDAWDACGKFGKSARSAEFIERVCPEGSIIDPNGSCYTCPNGFRRTAAAVTANNACFRNESLLPAEKTAALTCKAGEHFDFADDGTCWSCPEASVRSAFDVRSDQACEYTNMRWNAATRTPNGLFALPGAHEIVAEVITERSRIDGAIEKFVTDTKMNTREAKKYRAGVWNQIREEPEASPELKGAVYDHLYEVIKRGAQTKPERDMVNYLTAYVQDSRKLSASEMSNVWESWQRGREAWRRSRGNNLAAAYDTGVKPPDLRTAVQQVMHLGPAAGVTLAFLGSAVAESTSSAFAQLVSKFALQILPYRAKDVAGVATSTAGVAGVAAGPLIILTTASVVASFATDIALEQNKQESIVNDALAVAQRPVDIARLLKTDDGRNEVAGNWALMTQEPIKPHAKAWATLMPPVSSGGMDIPSITLEGERVVVGQDTALEAGGATTWELVPGDATDVAIGTDGTTYVIGVGKPDSGGYPIYKRAKSDKNWTKLSGTASRVAVSDTVAWVVNDKGQIYTQSGSKWRRVPGPAAQDIGASAKGVWITAVNGGIHVRNGNKWQKVAGEAQRIDIDQNGRPWVVNKQGNIYVHSNERKWLKQPGTAVDIAVDIPGKAVVVGKNGKTYLFNGTKRDWDLIAEETDSGAVGAGGEQVWRLTANNKIYRMR